MLRDVKVDEKYVDDILRISDMDNVRLNSEGKIENYAELAEAAKTKHSKFIFSEIETGAQTPNPPANNGGKMTRAEIYAKDKKGRYKYEDAERKRLIAENPEAFPNAFGINKGGI